jgi:hypothetical protein
LKQVRFNEGKLEISRIFKFKAGNDEYWKWTLNSPFFKIEESRNLKNLQIPTLFKFQDGAYFYHFLLNSD